MKRVFSRVALCVALIATAAVGATTLVPTEVLAGPCFCPLVYAPVICDHGKTYPNIYCARCKNATNCVPTGGL